MVTLSSPWLQCRLHGYVLCERVPVGPVVVVHVHENGHRLAQHDAAPHDTVAQLTLKEWDGSHYAQRDL